MRVNLIVGEAFIGLRRNLTMTVAAVIVVSIALALLGTANLIRLQIDEMKTYWYGKVEISLFLCRDIDSDQPTCPDGAVTDAQRASIQKDLENLPQVSEVYYESKDQAFARFKEQFAGTAIVDNVTVDDMQESFRAKLINPEKDYDVVASAFEGRPGVQKVFDTRSVLDTLFTVLNKFQVGSLAFAVIAFLATIMLIMVVIRVAAFSRRRETSIMRLVGASNLSIQLPFLLEGAFAGVVGALLAVVYLVVLKLFFVDQLLRQQLSFLGADFIGWGNVLSTGAIMLGVGLVLSIVVSYLTLLKYLRV